jgi:hypothetical protein
MIADMKPAWSFRNRLILILHDAFLGKIVPGTRRVSADWTSEKLVLTVYLERRALPNDHDLMGEVTSDVLAAFPEVNDISYVISENYSDLVFPQTDLVHFQRYEAQ